MLRLSARSFTITHQYFRERFDVRKVLRAVLQKDQTSLRAVRRSLLWGNVLTQTYAIGDKSGKHQAIKPLVSMKRSNVRKQHGF